MQSIYFATIIPMDGGKKNLIVYVLVCGVTKKKKKN